MTGGKYLSISWLEESCTHLAGLQLTSSVSLREVKLLSDLGEEKLARASNWLKTCQVIPCPGSGQTLTWRGPGDLEEEAGRSSSLPGEESQTCVEWWGLEDPSLSAEEWIICPWSSSSVISNQRPAASPCQAGPQLPHPPTDQGTPLDPLHLLDGGHVVHHPHVALVCNNVLTSEQSFYWRRQNVLAGRLQLVLIINIYNANKMVRQAERKSGKIRLTIFQILAANRMSHCQQSEGAFLSSNFASKLLHGSYERKPDLEGRNCRCICRCACRTASCWAESSPWRTSWRGPGWRGPEHSPPTSRGPLSSVSGTTLDTLLRPPAPLPPTSDGNRTFTFLSESPPQERSKVEISFRRFLQLSYFLLWWYVWHEFQLLLPLCSVVNQFSDSL